ncbi:unnamed protein product [Adineta ricciae]|uniref:Uncharacterized protein n=1 Tax=Adineta ricciae TaxID=249248 RepID=A0A814C1S5_ADIRI|nr:unnamed protein product [Adineta ricciae]CAF1296724.1 unnamed protein product [Adineta ricciae]
MAAFGISFPKITLCRSSTSKTDPTHVPSTTPVRTLSLSIKNVPSQPLHYDVSTAIVKKKTPTNATILAIDGETKQLPKNLSVFNELQLDDEAENIDERRRQEKTSSDGLICSPLSSPMGSIDHHPTRRLINASTEDEHIAQERKSNQTFTPPTSSLSNDSSSRNNLHSTISSLSVDLPELKYALEEFLGDNDPVYEIAEEFATICSLSHQDFKDNDRQQNVTTSIVHNYLQDQTHTTEIDSMRDKIGRPAHESQVSSHMKWYVSELRIHKPLIYRTQWTNTQSNSKQRQLSHSVNDLIQIHDPENRNYQIISKTTDDSVHSTLSLRDFHQQQVRHRSDDNILRNSYLPYMNTGSTARRMSLFNIEKRSDRPLKKKDDTLIRNESVKKKLFDILNDNELENACLEDMSDEFEDTSLIPDHEPPMISSYSSLASSSDDALYSSPPNELQLPSSLPLVSSSSHNNLSTHTTEYHIGRSRLITTSLEKIPLNNNSSNHFSSSCTLRPSYEHSRASWYTSPSPQWRVDDQLSVPSMLKRHPSKRDLNQLVTDYHLQPKFNEQRRKEQKHVSYSLKNTSTPLVDDSSSMLPIIQDKSSNLLMFI